MFCITNKSYKALGFVRWFASYFIGVSSYYCICECNKEESCKDSKTIISTKNLSQNGFRLKMLIKKDTFMSIVRGQADVLPLAIISSINVLCRNCGDSKTNYSSAIKSSIDFCCKCYKKEAKKQKVNQLFVTVSG